MALLIFDTNLVFPRFFKLYVVWINVELLYVFGNVFPNLLIFSVFGLEFFYFQEKTWLKCLKLCTFHSDRFSQDVLSKLKNKETIKNVLFYPVPCWDERDHPFDFRLFSKQIQVHLPNVELVYIKHMLVLNFRLESSRCVHFSLLKNTFFAT